MKLKKLAALATAFVMSMSVMPGMTAHAAEQAKDTASDVLFDDFDGNEIDHSKWLVAHKQWGGKNGGVVKENVSVSDGTLKLEGHGLQYEGDIKGIKRDDGKLTGAAIATRDYYASGSYEVVAKIAPDLGACSALWTFEYEEYYPGDEQYDPQYATYGYCNVNHEIDIEIPTATSKNPDPNFSSARFNTYQRENLYTPHFHDLGFSLNDGKFHTYRFDWHTGDTNQTARVEFYVDDKLMYTSYKTIPTNEGRFWIGVWFPYSVDSDKDGKEDTGWAGLADFDTTVFEIDSVKITPYHEAGDTEQHETYAYDGWAPYSFPEFAEKEHFEHITNGDFSKGERGWTIEDEAKIENGKAILSSGQVADRILQEVKVTPGVKYKITANVVTDGSKVTIGASKLNGTKDQSITVTESGPVSLIVDNETVNDVLKVYAKVDRWQGPNVRVEVDDISMVSVLHDYDGNLIEDTVYKDGWQQFDGKWAYGKDGKLYKGWLNDCGKWYYLDDVGYMVTGWQQVGNKWYYFSGSGAMVTGWQQISNKWYYFNGSGAMVTGWQQISNKWYYFNGSGAMVTGWQQISNKWYYFNGSGAMVTGWQQISNKWYYFNDSGAMVTGWQQIKNVWYYFNDSGAMVTGKQVINGKTYIFDASGAWMQ